MWSAAILSFNPLCYMPMLACSNSAANENMMSKIRTNGIEHIVGKENVFNSCLLLIHQNEYLWSKGFKEEIDFIVY